MPPTPGEIAVLNALLEAGPSYAFEIRKAYRFNRYQTVTRAIERLKRKKCVQELPKRGNPGQRGRTVRLTKLGFMLALAAAMRPPLLPKVLENNGHLLTKREHRTRILLSLWNADRSNFDYMLMVYALKWPDIEEAFADKLFSDHLVFMFLIGTPVMRKANSGPPQNGQMGRPGL